MDSDASSKQGKIMDIDTIITRIAELQEARHKLIAEAERQVAFIDGGILELKKCITPTSEPSVTITVLR